MGNLTSCETSAPVPKSPAKAKEEEGPPALFFAGPSGVGKGTIIDKLMAANPEVFGFSVSHTSRPPRPGEVDTVNCAYCAVKSGGWEWGSVCDAAARFFIRCSLTHTHTQLLLFSSHRQLLGRPDDEEDDRGEQVH